MCLHACEWVYVYLVCGVYMYVTGMDVFVCRLFPGTGGKLL